MKFLLIFLLLGFLSAKTTQDEIKLQTQNLNENEKSEKELNEKLEDIANEIKKYLSNIQNTQKDIEILSQNVENLEIKAKDDTKNLEKLNSQNLELLKQKDELEKEITKVIVDDLAFDLIVAKDFKNLNGLISEEMIKILDKILGDEMKKISKNYEEILSQINQKTKQISQIKLNLQNYQNQKNKLFDIKNFQQNSINKLEINKKHYLSKLESIKSEQEEIRKTLKNLKIIDDKEQEELRKKAKLAEEKAQAERQRLKKLEEKQTLTKQENKEIEKLKTSIKNNQEKIRQIGSSYQTSKIANYKGKKTIAPLDNFIVFRKFGNYTDEIYNIKIFNENVILRSKYKNAKVVSIFDGKVVFANKTSVLDNVVIVENSGGIHTIYGHLSQIAPTIKIGSYIKKGYVLGRVEQDLTFEITQKNFHIDPLNVISLK